MHPRKNRWSAVLGALICSGVVLFALFRDVRTVSDFGASQAYIIVALALAMISGYYISVNESWVKKIMWGLVFIVATLVSVGLGGGRNNAMLEEKVSQAQHATTAQADHKQRLVELRIDRDEARSNVKAADTSFADAQKEQKAQCGRKNNEERCEGATRALDIAQKSQTQAQSRRDTADSTYDKLSTQVIDARPTARPNAELNGMTEVLALFTSSEQRAQELFLKLWPFVLAMLGEVGLIMCAHEAFEHHPPPALSIKPVEVKPHRKLDNPNATVTTAQLAKELGMEQKNLRKLLRKRLKVDRPDGGWVFTREEADALKLQAQLVRSQSSQFNA